MYKWCSSGHEKRNVRSGEVLKLPSNRPPHCRYVAQCSAPRAQYVAEGTRCSYRSAGVQNLTAEGLDACGVVAARTAAWSRRGEGACLTPAAFVGVGMRFKDARLHAFACHDAERRCI